MGLSKNELLLENSKLEGTIELVRKQISELSTELYDDETKLREFKTMMWDTRAELDAAEMKTLMTSNDLEVYFLEQKAKKFKKLYSIQNKPYFGRIDFKENDKTTQVYIGITNVNEDLTYHVYDWRSPICSMFYDFGVEEAYYNAPEGKIEGEIILKRQYQIKDAKLDNVFDTTINIDDEVLQNVLKENSNEHMRNIVNTIQKEQNLVIRDDKTKCLIVQGIAGSGKTSVALHRIAYLLYKLDNLNSNNVLIFSPNNIFSEYISNVLPELGEDNTLISTFHDFANKYITEYYKVESYSAFLARFYKKKQQDNNLIEFKLSDDIIPLLEKYVENIVAKCEFIKAIEYQSEIISKEELNDLLKVRFNKFNLLLRFDHIAEKINNSYFKGRKKDYISIKSLLLKSINMDLNMKKLYKDFFNSNEFLSVYKLDFNNRENTNNLNKKILNYEDAPLFIYFKFLLTEIPYKVYTKLVVIDEAQDYTYLQYKIIKSIFKNASFTILGDVNQTINPYYKYDSLDVLRDIFDSNNKYLELNKTYRSSAEIIEYANTILDLNHACAVRRGEIIPVKETSYDSKYLIETIKRLKEKYNNFAIITKSIDDAYMIYEDIKDDIDRINVVDIDSDNFSKTAIIIPAYAAKGLEFDSVIIIDNFRDERYLYYVAVTRAQHELVILKK